MTFPFVVGPIEYCDLAGSTFIVVENPVDTKDFSEILTRGVIINKRIYRVRDVLSYAHAGVHRKGERIGVKVEEVHNE